MVTKEKAVEILIQNFYSYKDSDVIEKLSEYLLDEREDAPTNQEFSTLSFYMSNSTIKKLECFDEVGKYIDCEAGKILKKLALYIINSNHRSDLNFFYNLDEKYSLLKEIGASDEYVRKNLDYGYNYYFNKKAIKIFLLYQDSVAKFYIERYVNLATSRGLGYAIEMLSIIINSVNSADELDIKLVEKYGDRIEEFKLAIEKIAGECFRKKYQNHLEKVKELVRNNEEFKDLLELFDKSSEIKLEFVSNKVGIDLLDNIVYKVKYPTQKCEKILKACMILSPKEFLLCRRELSFITPLIERFNLSESYGLDFLLQSTYSNGYSCNGAEKYVDKLIEEKPEIVRAKVFESKNNKNLKSSYLFAKLVEKNLMNEKEKREYLDWFEEEAIKWYRNEVIDVIKAEIEFPDESMKDFSFLKESKFPTDIKVKVYNPTYNVNGIIHFVSDIIPSLKESNVGINISKFNVLLCTALNSYQIYTEYYTYSLLFSRRDLLEDFYRAGMEIERLVTVFVKSYYNIIQSENIYSFLSKYITETNEAVKNIAITNIEECKKICQTFYKKESPFDIKSLLSWIDRVGVTILKYLETVFRDYPEELRSEIEGRVTEKKKVIVDFCTRLLRYWDNDKIAKDLKDVEDVKEVTNYLEKFFTKQLEKKVPYVDEIDYSCVREKNSEDRVDERVIKYYISEYMGLSDIYILNSCKKIAEIVNISDLRNVVYSIYEKWLEKGANPKQKNILLPATLIASPAQLEMLKKQINFWADNSKPGLVSFLIQCIATRGDKTSLIYVDSIAKKFKNKKIKNLAQSALEATAELYGMSLDELEEKIIPDFGFDRDRIKYFNYGERKIKALLSGDLEITLFDSTGKQIKSLPKASAKYNDDENLVVECKEELKVIKKQLKTVAELQKFRIQKALIQRRKWELNRWREVFVDNPLMNIFAIGLIWEELDSEGKLLGRFRYMEDGTFNTVDEDEYELGRGSFITFANLREMDEEEKNSWKEQLDDYEVTQPVEQLDILLYTLKKDEEEEKELEIASDKEFYPATFKKVMDKYGFKYNQDYYDGIEAATYTDIEREFEININLKEPLMMWEYDVRGSLKNITFNKLGDRSNLCLLKTIPMELLDYVYYVVRELTKVGG